MCVCGVRYVCVIERETDNRQADSNRNKGMRWRLLRHGLRQTGRYASRSCIMGDFIFFTISIFVMTSLGSNEISSSAAA